MPLVIRTERGKVVDLPEGSRYVEIRTTDGKLGALVYEDAQGLIVTAKPGEHLFERYCQLYRVSAAKVGSVLDVG